MHLCSFAVAFGVASDLANLMSVYWLGIWDPKWTQASSVAIFRYLLPVLVAIASLSCFVGARKHAEWLKSRSRSSISSGVVAGVLAAAALFVAGLAGRKLHATFVIELPIFLAGPAVISNVVLKLA